MDSEDATQTIRYRRPKSSLIINDDTSAKVHSSNKHFDYNNASFLGLENKH